jgi:glycosyltransferase involved in cell wall biosynthesis
MPPSGAPGGSTRHPSRTTTLLVLNQVQYGYHTPWYFFCRYLRSRFSIVYVCWDYGYPRVPDEGVTVRYVDRSGSKPARLLRFLSASMREVNARPGAVKVVRYFRGCSVLRLAKGTRTMVFDVRSGSILRSPLARAFEDLLIRVESALFRNITILSADLIPYLRLPERKCHVVPLGGEPMGLTPRTFEGLHLLYVGTLFQRELDKTVDGLAEFLRTMPGSMSVTYDIVGDGPDDARRRIEEAITRAGMEGRVRCHGRIAYTLLSELASRCNVGVAFVPLNDYFRSQPVTKVYEYLLAGMPVVATKNPQVLSVLNASNGVVHEDTPQGFADALGAVWERRNSYDSHRIAAEAQRHSWENITQTNLGPYLERLA